MANAKILVVEDHQDVRDLLSDVLAADYQIVKAVDGVSVSQNLILKIPI